MPLEDDYLVRMTFAYRYIQATIQQSAGLGLFQVTRHPEESAELFLNGLPSISPLTILPMLPPSKLMTAKGH